MTTMKLLVIAIVLAACGQSASAPAPASGPSHAARAFAATVHTCTPAQAGALCSDLLSQPIAPGAEGTQTVNLPAGYALVDGSVVLTGDAAGKFQVESATSTAAGSDSVELDVKFKNTSVDEVRFTADFSYAAGSGS